MLKNARYHEVDRMKKKLEDFFKIRPGMQKKYDYPGTYRDFVKDIARFLTPLEEEKPVQDIIMEKVGKILGEEISLERLKHQLLHYPIVSYADHHGLLNYKLLYNSNLLFAEIIKELKLPFLIVGATGNVPLKNESFPRGFYFKRQKFNFFGVKHAKTSVFLLDEKLDADKRKGIDSFIISYDRDLLTSEERKFLEYLFFDCLEIEKAAGNYEIFSDQLTFLNFKLWKHYFDKNIRDTVPDILYLQTNQIIYNALLEEIKKEDSLISLILFEPKARRIFLENFSGIQGCWAKDRGSQFFWGIGEKKKRVALHVDDTSNSLVGKNFKLELERDTIINALETRKLLPSLFFDFLIISFLGGYLTLGGFNQLDYLQQMQEAHVISLIDFMIQVQEAHVKSLNEIGMHHMADQFASRVTDGLVCGMMPFDFDSGIDLIWHYNSHNGKFNGSMDGGLTRADLDKMLEMKVKDMIASAVETMLENV